MNFDKKKKISQALINFGQKQVVLNSSQKNYFTPNSRADKLIWTNPLAFLLGVIFDQGLVRERAWEIPYLLGQRIGHLDVDRLARIHAQTIIRIFNQSPKLHRFPQVMALMVKQACQMVIKKYDRCPENIWNNNPGSKELYQRLLEFKGIGQKKASMAMNILMRDFNIVLKDKKRIDVSYDIHIRRVFLKTGLVKKDKLDLIIKTARELNPEYPGILDKPCWLIGHQYCHLHNQECKNCPLNKVCGQKSVDLSTIKSTRQSKK